MSTVYVMQFEDEDGTHVGWGVDKDGTVSVEVVGCEFFGIYDGGSVAEMYRWVQDCLGELDRIRHAPTREQASDWVCAQIDYLVDDHVFVTEDDLRSWQPDQYGMARSDYADGYNTAKFTLQPQNRQTMEARVYQLERLLEIAKKGAEMENADPDLYTEFMKEATNA